MFVEKGGVGGEKRAIDGGERWAGEKGVAGIPEGEMMGTKGAKAVEDLGRGRRSYASKHDEALNRSSVIYARDTACQYPDRMMTGTTCRASSEGAFKFRGFHNDRPAFENQGGTYIYLLAHEQYRRSNVVTRPHVG